MPMTLEVRLIFASSFVVNGPFALNGQPGAELILSPKTIVLSPKS